MLTNGHENGVFNYFFPLSKSSFKAASDGTIFWVTTLPQFPNGSIGTATVCVPNDCYAIYCGGGLWQNEVYWELSDTNGIVLRYGGAPHNGSLYSNTLRMY